MISFSAIISSGRRLILDARVKVLFVFAHDDQIHHRVLGADEGIVRHARADVGVEAQHLARGHVQALVTSALRRGDGSLQKHLGAAQGIPGAGHDAGRVARKINLLADFDGFDVQKSAGGFQNVQRGGHDLGADAVAMRDSDRGAGCHELIGCLGKRPKSIR